MKDKSVFDIQKLDLDALARSMGLSKAPRIRFYEKFLGKNPTASVEAAPQQPGAWRSNAEEGAFTFFDDEENNAEENDDDSDDDIMKLKRKDHDVEQGPDDEFAEEKKKKEKHLTKEQAAKRIIRKNLTANKITNFDEEGNVSRLSTSLIAKKIQFKNIFWLRSAFSIPPGKRCLMWPALWSWRSRQ